MKRKKNSKAFTLIELMVAVSIAAIISLAVMSVLGSGLMTYDRIQSYGNTQTDVLLALEEMEKNLRNTFYFSEISFIGKSERIEFAHIFDSVDDVGKLKEVTGKIIYYFNKEENSLIVEKQDYAKATSEEATSVESGETLTAVKSFKWSYYYLDLETEKYEWKNSWDGKEEVLPKGVKMEVIFQDGQKDVKVERIVLIPAAR